MRTILVFLNNMSIDKIEDIRQKHDPFIWINSTAYNNRISI